MECARYVLMTSLPISRTNFRRRSGQLAVLFTLAAAAAVVGKDEMTAVASEPRRQPNGLHYAVHEELQIGTQIADVVADAGLHKFGVEALRTMRFRLLNQPTGGLVIGNTTGILSVGSRLDREQLCLGVDDSCQLRLDVAVQPMAYFQIIKVKTTTKRACTRFMYHIQLYSPNGSKKIK